MKKMIPVILFIISVILVVLFLFVVRIDWLNYYMYAHSAPFYAFILFRFFEYVVPAIICSGIAIFIKVL